MRSDAMPLHGKTILTTRAAGQSDLDDRLRALGARVVACPTIEIAPPGDWSEVDHAIHSIGSYHWILFTSANAVQAFMTRVETLKAVCSIPIAVVGPATAARLERWRLRPQLIPADFRAEGLLQAFPEKLDGARILFPRAETARELLPEELRRRGAAVDIVVVYRTVKGAGTEDLPALLARERIDCIAFTSPSTARFAAAALSEEPRLLDSIPVAVIGPVTRGAVEEMGFRATIEAGRATAEDLASAIEVYFSGESREAIPKTDR